MGIFRGNRNLAIIALIALVNALGYGIIIPVVYSYVARFGLSAFQYSLLFALFSLCQFLSTPIIGRMSDRFGRRPLLIGSLIGTTLSFFMMAFAPSAIFLFLARALDGITAGNIPVASAVITDTTEEKDRAKGFGIIGATFGFGFLFGPAISGFTVGINPTLPFIIAGIITAVATLLTALFLPETNNHIGEVEHKKLFDFGKLYHSLFEPNIGMTLLVTLFYFTAFGIFIAIFQLFCQEVLHLNATIVSFIYTLYGLVGLITQFFLIGPITRKLGIKKAFMTGLLVCAFAYIGMYFSVTLVLFVLVSVLLGLASSTVSPLTQTILSMETDAKSQGSMQGLNASYMSIGQIIGPIIGGIAEQESIPMPFLISALIMFFCFALSFQIVISGKKESAF